MRRVSDTFEALFVDGDDRVRLIAPGKVDNSIPL